MFHMCCVVASICARRDLLDSLGDRTQPRPGFVQIPAAICRSTAAPLQLPLDRLVMVLVNGAAHCAQCQHIRVIGRCEHTAAKPRRASRCRSKGWATHKHIHTHTYTVGMSAPHCPVADTRTLAKKRKETPHGAETTTQVSQSKKQKKKKKTMQEEQGCVEGRGRRKRLGHLRPCQDYSEWRLCVQAL